MNEKLMIDQAMAILEEAESALKRFHQETANRLLTDAEQAEYKALVNAENAAHKALTRRVLLSAK